MVFKRLVYEFVNFSEIGFKTPELTELIVKLDERYNDKVKKHGIAMARKPKRVGSSLLSRPPTGAPYWLLTPIGKAR